MNRLDPDTLELHGTHLIEASAGTGKTHNIATLYLRLLEHGNLTVDQIAVVTFTHAATAELRDRIRARVGEALRGKQEARLGRRGVPGGPAADAAGDGGTMLAEDRLRAALREIDTAAIFTIHGFCQRLLRDHAFDSGMPFETVMVTDELPLLREVVDDFWVRATHAAPEVFVRHLAASTIDADAVLRLAALTARTPGVRVLPEAAAAGAPAADWSALATATASCATAFDSAAALWAAERPNIEALLCDRPGLHRGAYKPEAIRSTWRPELDDAFAADDPLALGRRLSKRLARLTNDGLAEKTNKGHTPPSHPFFDACQAYAGAWAVLARALDDAVVRFLRRAVDEVAAGVTQRKARANALGYGDLLTRLDRALDPAAGPSAEHLTAQLRARFRAVLIDEFQDTDPVQYRIFQRIAGAAGAGSGAAAGAAPALFLIGDPKQAIYAFRGADVFAYLQAVRDTPESRRWTLDQNWRSDPGLIAAVNALFDTGRVPRPFAFDEIGFSPVRPKDDAVDRLRGPAGRTAPLEILLVRRDSGIALDAAGQRITVGEANDALPGLVAAEIGRLLDAGVEIAAERPEDATTGGEPADGAAPFRPVEPGDVAVLVRTNDQAARVQGALRHLRIPSVLHSDISVLDTDDAGDLERVLAAVVNPSDGAAVRSALATALLGCDARALWELQADEAAWDARAGRFMAWHALWREHGFIQAFRRLLDDEDVAARLLALPDGERRMTNVLHLGELLHAAAVRGRLSMLALAAWYTRVRRDPAARAGAVGEAALLRLESDARAVRIVTVHKAKGLEYPIVYCPFLWAASKVGDDGKRWPMYHDPAADGVLTLSLAGADDPAAQAQAEREAFAEDLRLLYVAVTRARHRCSVVWGGIGDARASALAYLLHGSSAADALADDGALVRALGEGVVAAAGGAIAVAELPFDRGTPWQPPAAAPPPLDGRGFRGRIDRTWRAASFSSLTHAAAAEALAAAPPRAPDGLAPATADDSGRDHDAETAAAVGTDAIVAEIDDLDAGGGRPDAVMAASAGAATPGAAPGRAGAPAGMDRVALDALPAGADAGNVIHAVLEHADFAHFADAGTAGGRLRASVARQLRQHGFDADAWADAVWAALADVVDTPLVAGAGGLNLRAIPQADRITEMEFTFPVVSDRAPDGGRVTPAGLAAALAGEAVGPGFPAGYAERVRTLGFAALAGYLRGYVDLAFRRDGRWYLVDYKSNRLGPTYDHYAPDRLADAMARHHYVLQYHLYVVALHRFLCQRLGAAWDYERGFGGVLYLFVRGMHPGFGPRRGVFYDRPPAALVERLSGLFDDPAAAAPGRGAAR